MTNRLDCGCGQIYGDPCDGIVGTGEPTDVPTRLSWVPPCMRGTAQACGGPDDCGPEFWEPLTLRAECAEIVFETPDPWGREEE